MGSGADRDWNDLEPWQGDNALARQVDGNHYKDLAIQPMEYSFKNKLDPAQHTAIKYITRFRNKNGRKDLEKAIHCIEMLIELEYGVSDG